MTDGEGTNPRRTDAAPRSGRRSSSGRRTRAAVTPRRTLRSFLTWGAVAIALLVGGGTFTAYSETSGFCPTCHEMAPYYDAWQQGRHHGSAQCVDCHIDPGVIAHVAHKPGELVELWDHFFVDYRFPNYSIDMPNSRCVHCHPSVTVKTGSRFSHKLHETKAQCHDCHNTTGHEVSLAFLRDAGVLKNGASMPKPPNGLTPSALNGHIKVICQKCHDQVKMKCTTCHTPPHEPRGECSNCHRPGDNFIFVHPTTTSDCSRCHTQSASHPKTTGPCSACHRQPGTGWAFSHPVARTDCASCHTPPANHFGANCVACHSPSVPFASAVFNHPANTGDHSWRSFPCVRCHPKDYTSASCTCHGGRAPSGGG